MGPQLLRRTQLWFQKKETASVKSPNDRNLPSGRTQNTSVSYLPGGICLTPREVFTNRSIKEARQLGGCGWEEEVNKLGTVRGGVGLAPHGLLCFRPDKMSFFSSWMKAIFIIVLLFPLHSETALLSPGTAPDCHVYKDRLHLCNRERKLICATNGQTYRNPCIFCRERIASRGRFDFTRYGAC
ncbi:uncharacterized protein [Equus przewalskii]|uniref:Uncharacterized protein isoform X2 n=1 Tax=Equus przewalskii TaxID=9798 RepID=A0ABM4KAZ9_EQUPR